jgi:AcrR family transcriptional regulator
MLITKKPDLTQRQVNALVTKDKLFKAAIKLFSNFGYERVTIDDIANECGTAKGSFYTHFKSKEHIMLEQFKLIDLHYEQWFHNFNPDANVTNQLSSFIECIMNFAVDGLGLDILKVVFSGQISLSSRLPKLLADEDRPYFKIMYTVINCGQEKGEFRNDMSGHEIARLLTRWVRSIVYDWCLFDGQFDLVEKARADLPLLTGMLAPKDDI